ncbi:MAG: hypothetical protein ACRDYF_09485, partial [Acidimicrobiia bacterium]
MGVGRRGVGGSGRLLLRRLVQGFGRQVGHREGEGGGHPDRRDGEDIAFYTGTLNEADGKLKSLDLGGGDSSDGAAAPSAPALDFEAALNALPDGTDIAEFEDLIDDTGSLFIRAPKNWGAVEKAPANPLTGGGRPLPHVGASADAGAFRAVTGPG